MNPYDDSEHEPYNNPAVDTMIVQQMYKHLMDVHKTLDLLKIPREIAPGNKMSAAGRITWLIFQFPELKDLIIGHVEGKYGNK